jgi:hypothetical protein
MHQTLRDAIDAQYAAFPTTRPRTVEGCPCCTSPEQLAALVAAPREALGAATLDFYARKAMTTVGSQAEFRYFWPRLAELAIDGELLTDTEIVFGKPVYGDHHTWPPAERAALIRLASALGEWLGAEELEPSAVDEWVCVIALLAENVADPRDFLRPLLAATPAAWTNLRSFVDRNRDRMQRKGRLSNQFWDSAPKGASLMIEWLSSEPRAVEAARALDTAMAKLYGMRLPE